MSNPTTIKYYNKDKKCIAEQKFNAGWTIGSMIVSNFAQVYCNIYDADHIVLYDRYIKCSDINSANTMSELEVILSKAFSEDIYV